MPRKTSRKRSVSLFSGWGDAWSNFRNAGNDKTLEDGNLDNGTVLSNDRVHTANNTPFIDCSDSTGTSNVSAYAVSNDSTSRAILNVKYVRFVASPHPNGMKDTKITDVGNNSFGTQGSFFNCTDNSVGNKTIHTSQSATRFSFSSPARSQNKINNITSAYLENSAHLNKSITVEDSTTFKSPERAPGFGTGGFTKRTVASIVHGPKHVLRKNTGLMGETIMLSDRAKAICEQRRRELAQSRRGVNTSSNTCIAWVLGVSDGTSVPHKQNGNASFASSSAVFNSTHNDKITNFTDAHATHTTRHNAQGNSTHTSSATNHSTTKNHRPPCCRRNKQVLLQPREPDFVDAGSEDDEDKKRNDEIQKLTKC